MVGIAAGFFCFFSQLWSYLGNARPAEADDKGTEVPRAATEVSRSGEVACGLRCSSILFFQEFDEVLVCACFDRRSVAVLSKSERCRCRFFCEKLAA